MIPACLTIHAYVHQGRIGVLVEVGTDTDFAARTEAFNTFCRDLAMHIAAANPTDIDALLTQPFVKDSTQRIDDCLAAIARQLDERVTITRFVRWDQKLVYDESPEPPKRPAVILRGVS